MVVAYEGAAGTARSRGRRALAAVTVAVLLVACGGGDVDEPVQPGSPSGTAGPTSDDVDPTGDDAPTASPSTAEATSPPAVVSPTDAPPTDAPSRDPAALPGEPYDHPYVHAGDVLGVIGVAHDDTLDLRALPTLDAPVLATLGPTAYGLVSTGRTQVVAGRSWHEVTVDGRTGWVSWRYVSFVGPTTDDTARFVANRGYVEAATMAALGRDVASFYEPFEPEVPPRVVMSVAPTVGDLGEVTYDVVGIQDDAGAGFRVHVFGQPTDDGEGFTLRTIEVTDLCDRGGTPETACP